jgi:hypothetical protein
MNKGCISCVSNYCLFCVLLIDRQAELTRALGWMTISEGMNTPPPSVEVATLVAVSHQQSFVGAPKSDAGWRDRVGRKLNDRDAAASDAGRESNRPRLDSSHISSRRYEVRCLYDL